LLQNTTTTIESSGVHITNIQRIKGYAPKYLEGKKQYIFQVRDKSGNIITSIPFAFSRMHNISAKDILITIPWNNVMTTGVIIDAAGNILSSQPIPQQVTTVTTSPETTYSIRGDEFGH